MSNPAWNGGAVSLSRPMSERDLRNGNFGGQSVMNQTGNATHHAPDGLGRQPQPVYTTSRPVGDTVAEQAVNHIASTNEAFRSFVDECEADKAQYTAEGHAQRVQGFQKTEAFKGIDSHVEAVEAHVAELEASRANVIAGLSPAGDAAQESRNDRAWAAALRTLDATENVGELSAKAAKVIENAPEGTRGVILEQIRPYLDSRGCPTAVVDTTTAKVAPELAAVDAELAQAVKHQAVVKYDANTVKAAIAGGRPAVKVVGLP
jgi:hypothetical protein